MECDLIYVKPDRRWLYLKRRINIDEIYFDKVVMSEMIPLTKQFYDAYYLRMSTVVWLYGIMNDLSKDDAKDLIKSKMAKSEIINMISYFMDPEMQKLIKNIPLVGPNATKILKTAIENLKEHGFTYYGRQLAELVNNGNANGKLIVNSLCVGNKHDRVQGLLFVKYVTDTKTLEYIKEKLEANKLDFYMSNNIEIILYKHHDITVKRDGYINKIIKGHKWALTKWHGLKNIVQKILAR